ncbi:MAG: hypothetical protein KDD51_00530 [Bdellovibrionales bacterium]|nr:hypothetical protein [Bdellovibrionales bacterium]
MKTKRRFLQRSVYAVVALLGMAAQAAPLKVVPSEWGIYHGAFPDLTAPASQFYESSKIMQLESMLAKPLAWVQVQDDFVEGIQFPWPAVEAIEKLGKVPYIRLMPLSRREQNFGKDPLYNLENILRGDFDRDLREYARNAKLTGSPLIMEFAPEANGRWYPWNGLWNGGGETTGYGDPALADGPERYRDAYRRVIDIFRVEGVENVTWVFHVDSQPKPTADWNKMALYYPGDEYIDWIGISVFGAQFPWDYWNSFTQVMDQAYDEFAAISPNKPLAVVEFGVIEDSFDPNRKANWLREALTVIRDERYARIKAISYWHESSWIPTRDNNLRLDSSPQALEMYNRLLQEETFLGELEVTWP